MTVVARGAAESYRRRVASEDADTPRWRGGARRFSESNDEGPATKTSVLDVRLVLVGRPADGGGLTQRSMELERGASYEAILRRTKRGWPDRRWGC